MARKTIYLDSFCGMDTAAVVENGKICEFELERQNDDGLIGNIYKGRVCNVLNGMQAAFIDCGLERNCYISVENLFPNRNKYEGKEVDIPSMLDLHEGDEIMVQVLKPPVGNKGAKVTTCLSFVGKSLIYLPQTPFIGISRKIDDEELRKNLTFMAERLKRDNEGIIVRTAAPYANRTQLKDELTFHRNVCAKVLEEFPKAKVGALLHSEMPLPVRVLRDTISYNIDKIVVGNPALGERIQNINNLYPPRNRRSVVVHNTGRDMMHDLGLNKEIANIYAAKVPIENGANLVIERTEALTVIDVNTGKFVGNDSLEQTVYQTNIAAAREIARQVRLRNIGGIIVVDFIDMENVNHRNSLTLELEKALQDDKAKCRVLPMSEFGLIQFTRKRMGKSILDTFTKPCAYCKGEGHTRTNESILLSLRAKLLNALFEGNQSVYVDMNVDVANALLNWKEFAQDIFTRYPQAKVYIIPHRTYHEESFAVRCSTGDLPKNAVLLY